MKRTLLMLLMVGVTVGAMAQTTREVKGTVIDKNGNPLPGAKVEATGGAENTVTDADGTFSIEVPRYLKRMTATYPGMKRKTLNSGANNDLLFEMRRKHTGQNKFFVSAMMAHGFDFMSEHKYSVEGGVMFGQFIGNNWGWFCKGMVGTYPGGYGGNLVGSATIGGLRRIIKSMYGYIGFGFGSGVECHFYRYYDYDDGHRHECNPGVAIDWGLIFRIKPHINVITGLSAQGGPENDYFDSSSYYYYRNKTSWRLSLQLGVGYTF